MNRHRHSLDKVIHLNASQMRETVIMIEESRKNREIFLSGLHYQTVNAKAKALWESGLESMTQKHGRH